MITSSQNNLVKRLKALKNKKNREKEQVFIAEGIRFINEIPIDFEVELFAASQSFADKNNTENLENIARLFVFDDKIFDTICDTENTQGILAVCKQKKYSLNDISNLCTEKDFVAVCEDINDPGNLGTIIRTADACGAKAVILTKGCVDVYNSKVLRSTMGSVFHLPIITDTETNEVLSFLKANDFTTFATFLGNSIEVYNADFNKKTAIFIGNEARGISDEVASKADCLVKIPMLGQAESFNASVAAGIVMYEAVRQKNLK